MSTLVPLLFGLAALLLQQFLAEAIALDVWTPDLLTVVLLWIGIARGPVAGAAITVAITGLLADGFAASPAGLHMLHALMLYYLAALLGSRVRFHGLAGRLMLGVLGGLASVGILAGLARVFMPETALADRLGQLLLARVALVVACTPLAFPILDRLDSALVRTPDNDRL